MHTRFATRFLPLVLLGLGACGGDDAPTTASAAAGQDAVGAPGAADPSAPPRDEAPRKTVAYVTNGIASFWKIAEAGALAAGEEFGVNVLVEMPPPPEVAEQKRLVESLLNRKVDGIAISPVDSGGQGDLLAEIAARTNLITHDSDAPDSERLAFIGVDNYSAGRMCGELVAQALPDGGELMIFVGRIEQTNARLRRQGLIDELLGRSIDNTRYDKPGKELKGDKYTILDTRTDNFDPAASKSQAEDALAKYPEIDCMVGLFAYNPPAILEALETAGMLGVVQVVGFDEDSATLRAIEDGHCFGTVVQDPYGYGYESVKMLAALADGDRSVLPEGGVLDIPAKKITKSNVVDFRTRLEALVGDAKGK